MWNHAFCLQYTVTLSEHSLGCSLSVLNKNPEQGQFFSFTSLLHTYFRIDEISQLGITGLKGVSFFDKLDDPARERKEDRDTVVFSQETDRIYADVGEGHRIRLLQNGHPLCSTENLGFRDTVVWNPWIQKAKAMEDFGDEEFRTMVCVELGTVSKPVTLAPGETWVAGQVLHDEPKA